MAKRMPRPGRVALTPMLSSRGRLIGDFTVARLGPQLFQATASYAAQAYHLRWFRRHLPDSGVSIRNVSQTRVGFQIAGPAARDLLQRVTRADVSSEALPFLSVRELEVGLVPAIVSRITYTGDLGYEIYVAPEYQLALYDALTAAGRDLGLAPFGMRAMMSLRLEKSFGSWLREYKPDYTAAETGLDRFIAFDKGDFIGREAALREREAPPQRRLCTFVVDAGDADVWADEPIWCDGEVVGFVTSGGYAHYVGESVALGFVPAPRAQPGAEFEIEILGEQRPARLIKEPLFDPLGERMRG
jgi:dimethylglycine dehydrogenase